MKKNTTICLAIIAAGIVPFCGFLLYYFALNFMVLSANTCDGPIYRLVQNSGGMSKAAFVSYVKQNNLNVNETCGSGITPLHEAIGHNPAIIPYLVELGGSVNAQDENGNTPLHYAVERIDIKYTKILLKSGASPLIKNKGGLSPLDVCVQNSKLYPDFPTQTCKMMRAYLPKH